MRYRSCGLFALLLGAIAGAIGQQVVNKCRPGTYHGAADGQCLPCTPGLYSDTFGAEKCKPCLEGFVGKVAGADRRECDGKCPAGYFCEEGTVLPKPCGRDSVYCPAGSAAAIEVPPGHYSTGLTNLTRSAVKICEPGFFCESGVKQGCKAGTYNSNFGGESESDCTPSPLGTYSTFASVFPRNCPPGRFGGTTGLKTASCSGPCEIGYYCPEGSRSSQANPCPSGLFGKAEGLTSKLCSNMCNPSSGYCVEAAALCSPGHYCPMATKNEIECGDQSFFCPRGSSVPTPVTTGYYSVKGGEKTRSAERICEKGHFCTDGVMTPCRPGRYGDKEGLSSYNCSGFCSPGYYCELGATTSFQHRCGGADVFCPIGSWEPTPIRLGYFGVGTDILTFEAQEECSPGFYCTGGLKIPCPEGTFGASSGLSGSECSGLCPIGHFCPQGTIVPNICPAGRFGASTGLATAECSGPCAAGYFCKEGSTVPDQFICSAGEPESSIEAREEEFSGINLPHGQEKATYYGASNGEYGVRRLDAVYCPEGSGSPTVVSNGFFAAGGTRGSRTHQIFCDPTTPNQWDATLCDLPPSFETVN